MPNKIGINAEGDKLKVIDYDDPDKTSFSKGMFALSKGKKNPDTAQTNMPYLRYPAYIQGGLYINDIVDNPAADGNLYVKRQNITTGKKNKDGSNEVFARGDSVNSSSI